MRGIDERGNSLGSERANEGGNADGSRAGAARAPGEETRSFDSAVERIRSELQDSGASASRIARPASRGDRFAAPIGAHRILRAALQGAMGGSRRRFRSLPESSSSRSDEELWRDDPAAGSAQTSARPQHTQSVSDRRGGPEGGRVHDVPSQVVQASGSQRPCRSDSGAPRGEADSLPSEGEPWRADRTAESSRRAALSPDTQSVPERSGRLGRWRMGDVPERPIQGERPERPHRSSNGAANREASLLHSDGGRWRADQAAESLQPAARPAHRQSVSGLSNVPERLHVDKATAQNVQGAISDSYSSRSDKLNAALREIASARNIGTFSRKVVHHKGELKGKDLSEFLRNAAGRFDARFVAQLEENIRSSWGYATTCNAVSGDAGGQAGMRACRALAAQVSRLDKALLTQVDLRAFSFSHHRSVGIPGQRNAATERSRSQNFVALKAGCLRRPSVKSWHYW